VAVLRAFEATVMRDAVGAGRVVDFGRNLITVSDGFTTTELFGPFGFLVHPTVGETLSFDPSGRLPLLAATGSLTGYEVSDGLAPGYTVGFADAPAGAALPRLARGDTDGFQRIVFAGDDSLFGSRERDLLIGYAGDDLISGSDGGDSLAGKGGRDKLYGGDGADTLRGGKDQDWLFGGADGDRLFGGGGDDFLEGEHDADLLQGGRGRDKLEGGADADTFRFASTTDSPPGSDFRDIIRDFGRGADVIDLRPIDADADLRGNQPFTWIGDAPFSGEAGQLRFSPGDRLLAGDTDGDGRADFEVTVKGPGLLTEGDVLL
jgi:RTX calcium-binding nonapeptide repeat (4 copies)